MDSISDRIVDRLGASDEESLLASILVRHQCHGGREGWTRYSEEHAKRIPKASLLARLRHPVRAVEAHARALRDLAESADRLELVPIDDNACDIVLEAATEPLTDEEEDALRCWIAAELSLSTVAAHGQRSVVGLKEEGSNFRFRVVAPTRTPFVLALFGRAGHSFDVELENHHKLLLETHDSAERLTAEADTSQRSLSQVLDTLDEGYFEVDPDGSLTVSQRFVELTGIEVETLAELREEWLYRSPIEKLEDNREHFERMNEARRDLVVLDLIVDGRHRTFECFVDFEMDRLTGTITDASERYRALHRDAVRKQTLELLVENAPFAIAVHRDNELLFINEQYGEELRPYIDDVTDRTVAYSRGTSLLTQNELSYLDSSGTQRTYELSTSMIDWLGGGAFLTVFRDVTQERAFLARSFELDRIVALGTLADGVAHEINNPLAYVQSNLEFAIRQLKVLEPAFDEQHEVIEALSEAVEGSGRVSKLVKEFRAVSPNQVSDSLEQIDIEEVISQSRNLASATVKPRASISTTIDVGRCVVGSSSRLAQVLINLLVNAAQAFPDDKRGNISLSAFEVEDSIRIEVRDNGSGIPPEVLEDVFKPFFTTKPAGEGTGLGLSICRNIIEGMNGTLELESRLGKGTTAIIELPATEPVDVIEEALADESSAVVEVVPSILVVDDDEHIGRMIERVLRERADVVVCQTVADALAVVREERFDLVITDYMMPKMNGSELAVAIVDIDPSYRDKIVIMSGGRIEQPFEESLPILQKPFGMKEIRRLVTEHDSNGRGAA